MNLKSLIKTYRAATNVVEWMGGALWNGAVSLASGNDLTLTDGDLVLTAGRLVDQLVTVTYSAAPVVDLSQGNHFVMTITDNVAFVFGAPTNTPTTGEQFWTITCRNTSGGAHGAGTWNAVFKTQATVFPAIATGFSRTIAFIWNGTNHVECWRSAADIAN